MPLSWLDDNDVAFPAVSAALQDPNGLLAVGGDLRCERLIAAYRRGIFPWYEEGQPILWWSPDPRMVLLPEELRVSGSLLKFIRRRTYRVTMDRDFAGVINACAAPRREAAGTWITPQLSSAFNRLHDMGIAHSVEVWDDQRLAGGLYGVAMGQMFFGESMFSRDSNTSKLALVFLAKQLKRWHYRLIDCQVSSKHLTSMGARELPRMQFQDYLLKYIDEPGQAGPWQSDIDMQQLIDEL